MTGLERFIQAQEGVYEQALAEVRRGRKSSHWMWFVLPQLAGLGRSATAQRYALRDLAEARAYLAHPVLGPRLREITRAVLGCEAPDAESVFGPVDAMKLRSSMTLFEAAADDPADAGLFAGVLERWFAGDRDGQTLARL